MKAALQKLKAKISVSVSGQAIVDGRRYLRSDIIGDLAISMSAGTLGVHNSLGDSLTSEVSELVEEVEVLGKDGATRTSRHGVLVIVDRRATARGNNFLV